MNWILILTIITVNGVSSQQITMNENNCRYYEQLYNSSKLDKGESRKRELYNLNDVIYHSQCLKVGEK